MANYTGLRVGPTSPAPTDPQAQAAPSETWRSLARPEGSLEVGAQPPGPRALTCEVLDVDVRTLADELLDAPGVAADGRTVQPGLSTLVPLVHFVFGF